VAFGDHLSTDKNIDPPTAEIGEKPAICPLVSRGVSVHATDPGFRKKALYFRLHPLGAKAKRFEGGSITLGTHWRHSHSEAAQMAAEFLAGAMPSKTDSAIVAVGYMAAAAAKEKIGVTSSIDQQQSLLTSSQGIGQSLAQGNREHISLSLELHVDDGDLGQGTLIYSMWQSKQMELSLKSIMI
jgi:hypothetical protein